MSTYDVIIIGAGVSGINAAYRVQSELGKDTSYTILENRGAIGGTWDLFRYPGIRSDSDLHTFGFPWRPWPNKRSIADGASIRQYVEDTAVSEGIDKKIKFHHNVKTASWSTPDQLWTITCDNAGREVVYKAKWVLGGTGYYDYNNPLPAQIPGLDQFKGKIIHPQFWPEDLDYTGKKMVIIGSGATAITLLPNLADKAGKVTMLQRSPSYIKSLPAVDPVGQVLKAVFPTSIAAFLIRLKFLFVPWLFFLFCRNFPNAAKKFLRFETLKQLPKDVQYNPHFTPRYNPWEQRLCLCPDGDFYKALHSPNADVATGHIETIEADGILLKSGEKIEADIIITATGLQIKMLGGIKIDVDGEPIVVGQKYMWKGVMLQDVPNAAFCIGYTNASWTLGADTAALLYTRVIKNAKKAKYATATPRVTGGKMVSAPTLNLNSTYVQRALDLIPLSGDRGNWVARRNYFRDYYEAKYGDATDGLEFKRATV